MTDLALPYLQPLSAGLPYVQMKGGILVLFLMLAAIVLIGSGEVR